MRRFQFEQKESYVYASSHTDAPENHRQMIKNIKKGALLNLKMLMAGAYSASRSSQSSYCRRCISPTILAILAKVQPQASKDGKNLQYISAKFNNLDDAAITIINDT